MTRRLLALVGAAAMILAAVVTRRAIDGESILPAPETAVYCEPALSVACDTAFGADRVVVEAPGITLDRVLAGEIDGALWVASPIWFEIVDDEALRAGSGVLTVEERQTLAHTELTFLTTDDATDACGGVVDWVCLADPDNGLDLGLDPMTTTAGLESYGRLVAAHLGTADFATNDFDRSFTSWRSRLDATIETGTTGSPAYAVHLARRGTFDVAIAPAAELATLDRELSGLVDSGARIEAAVAAFGDASLGGTSGLAEALVAVGWTEGPADDDGRPSAGVLQALRS